MNNNVVLATLLFCLTQLIIWFQVNGQFLSSYMKEHPLLLSLFGVPISYLFIISTKYAYEGFEGLLWPGRLVAFGTGIIIMAICTYIFFGEGLNSKTIISLLLSMVILSMQIFWK